MAQRKVEKTRKSNGNITHLCNTGEPWSPVSEAQAIREIKNGLHEYYTFAKSQRATIIVVSTARGKYLKTDKDSTASNNLAELPDC